MPDSASNPNAAAKIGKPIITFENVTKRWGKVIGVDNVSLTINEGEFFASWAVRLRQDDLAADAGRLEVPTEGRILIDGKDLERGAAEQAADQYGVSILCRVSAHDGAGQCRLWLGWSTERPADERTKRAEEALALAVRWLWRLMPDQSVRRSKTTRCAGARVGEAAARVVAGRASLGAGREAARRHALGADQLAGEGRDYLHHGDARSG